MKQIDTETRDKATDKFLTAPKKDLSASAEKKGREYTNTPFGAIPQLRSFYADTITPLPLTLNPKQLLPNAAILLHAYMEVHALDRPYVLSNECHKNERAKYLAAEKKACDKVVGAFDAFISSVVL